MCILRVEYNYEIRKKVSVSDEDEWLSIAQVCEILKVSDQTVYKMRVAGKIKSYYPTMPNRPEIGTGQYVPSSTVRISRKELMEYIESTGRKI